MKSKPKQKKPEHPCHHKELVRLNRIVGQLSGIKKMIEEQRYCPEILTQTQAVRAAIKSLEVAILETHLEHCVQDAFQSRNADEASQKIKEILELFRKAN